MLLPILVIEMECSCDSNVSCLSPSFHFESRLGWWANCLDAFSDCLSEWESERVKPTSSGRDRISDSLQIFIVSRKKLLDNIKIVIISMHSSMLYTYIYIFFIFLILWQSLKIFQKMAMALNPPANVSPCFWFSIFLTVDPTYVQLAEGHFKYLLV